MKTMNMLIAVLLVSALVLTVVLLVDDKPRTAMAEMINSGSDYTVLSTAPQAGGDATMITIIDNRSQRMLTYRLTSNKLEAVAQNDLTKTFPAVR